MESVVSKIPMKKYEPRSGSMVPVGQRPDGPLDLALGAAAVFATKRLYVTESAQQPLVNLVMAATDIGLAIVLVLLAILMVWRLVDLLKANGRWSREFTEAERADIAGEVSR